MEVYHIFLLYNRPLIISVILSVRVNAICFSSKAKSSSTKVSSVSSGPNMRPLATTARLPPITPTTRELHTLCKLNTSSDMLARRDSNASASKPWKQNERKIIYFTTPGIKRCIKILHQWTSALNFECYIIIPITMLCILKDILLSNISTISA